MSKKYDGQWANRFHGLEGIFRSERARKKGVSTIRRTSSVEKGDAVGFAGAKLTPAIISMSTANG